MLDAFGRWVYKKKMKWEIAKCTAICGSIDEVNNQNLVPRIAEGAIQNALNATYLGVTLSSKGVLSNINEYRGGKALKKTRYLTTAAGLDTKGPRGRTKYILENYLRISYTFNAFLLPNISSTQKLDK